MAYFGSRRQQLRRQRRDEFSKGAMTTQPSESKLAQRLLGLIDLTSLNDGDTEASVGAFTARASTPAGRVAAVCIWPRFIAVARRALEGTGVAVATVTNFPAGAADVKAAAAETAAAVAAGADEVDVVFPYRALLAGDEMGLALVRACRDACGARALLKVILETGQLGSEEWIHRAAQLAVEGGAHFLQDFDRQDATCGDFASGRDDARCHC